MELYRVYFGDKKLIIADEADISINSPNTLFASFDNKEIFISLLSTLQNNLSVNTIYVYHDNPEFVWETFKGLYTIIEAAGGLVLNMAQHALLIYRYGKWDLPKGKVEKGENFEQAAVREVKEECGLKQLTVKSKLSTTYHVYTINEKQILKFSHWYLMHCYENNPQLVPQTVENITDVKWMSETEVLQVLPKTYPNINNILTSFYIKSI
ncbi:MAG: NUDIX domain-containing protein [Bacteroidia bacterium]|nr:NUDIX domain-containing protein [Bacteroidia bacterium]MCZ2249337.1 NUDIX domain-containing protein [Bacteroidia bacterium]